MALSIEQLKLGLPVKVAPACKYFADWQHSKLTVVGMVQLSPEEPVDIWIDDNEGSGATDGFRLEDLDLRN